MSNQSIIIRALSAIWRWLDNLRRFLHLILVLAIFLFLLVLAAPEQPVIPSSAALVLKPSGVLVDQLSGDPFGLALARAQGFELGETLLKDLIDATREAADDERIKAIVLNLDSLTGAGLSKLQELAAELQRFRETGKPIFAVAASCDRNQYFLAAHADGVFLHPMGLVLIDGYSAYLPYFKSALDKLYIDAHAWTVGDYKSFVEPQTRDDMSPEDREARREYLSAMWNFYQRDVESARQLGPDSLQRYADNFVQLLRDAGGNTGQLALDFGLVDAVIPFDEMNGRIREIVGESSEPGSGYPGIDHNDYLVALRASEFPASSTSKLAVVVASGEILDGSQPPGTIGGESTARLIRAARTDSATRGLILRVDSPGGSAFASELILRELELFQETGRPIVVSMGSVAASGGYWISMSADEIWASPTSLTGSIGVGAVALTFDRALGQLGINIDGLGTTELSGQMNALQGIGDDISEYLGMSVQQIYDQFVGKVAEHRELSAADVERSAQGRVWIGSAAQERGLVDRIGGLEGAIESAAQLAGLAPDSYMIEYLEPEFGLAEQFLLQMVRVSMPVVDAFGFRPQMPEAIANILKLANEPLEFVERFNDPRGMYSYCFCDVR